MSHFIKILISFSILIFFSIQLSAQQCLVDAGPDQDICPGDSVQIGMVPVFGYTYVWTPASTLNNFFTGNPIAGPTSTTQYILTVLGPGCDSTSTDTVIVNLLPAPAPPTVYNFYFGTIQTGKFKECDALADSFIVDIRPDSGFSMTASGVVDSFTVDWGDSTIQTGLTTIPSTHVYHDRGVFTVKITVHGSNGCTSTRSYTVIFSNIPAVGITSQPNTEGCLPAMFQFTLEGDSVNPPGTRYVWDFGDSSGLVTWPYQYPRTVTKSITHTFNQTSCGLPNNEFIVKVSAISECGTKTATVDNVKVYQAPVADFDVMPTLGCTGTTDFCFTNTTVLGRNIFCDSTTLYTWDFGDGTILSAFSTINNGDACHTYTQYGTYTVTLKAFNRSQCDTSIHRKTIRVNAQPDANIQGTDSTGCVPLAITFDAFASTGGQLNHKWAVQPATGWNFVPPFHADSVVTRINFTVPAVYDVYLMVDNNCGVDTAIYKVIVGGAASLSLNFIPSTCDSSLYLPSINLDTAYGSITNVAWSFPGGIPDTSNLLFPGPILYSAPGFYTVTVSTITSCDTLSDTKNLVIFESPKADFVVDTVCRGFQSAFWDSSALGSSNIVSWQWDFGDGFTSTQQHPKH